MMHLSEPKFYGDVLDMSQTERDLWDENKGLIEDIDKQSEELDEAEEKVQAAEERVAEVERVLQDVIDLANECDSIRVAELRATLKELRDAFEAAL